MPGNDIPNLLSAIVIALTLVIVIYAKRTVSEAGKTTDKLGEVVTALQALVTAARDTVAVATAARDADRKHRQLDQLRTVSRLVEDIDYAAANALATIAGGPSPMWRCSEQNLLKPALFGVDAELPKCQALVGANGAAEVRNTAANAKFELDQVFRNLAVETPPSPGAVDGTNVAGSLTPGG